MTISKTGASQASSEAHRPSKVPEPHSSVDRPKMYQSIDRRRDGDPGASPSSHQQLLFGQDEAEMTQADWDMEAAIEAADSGRPINPSISEEMWGHGRGGSQQVNAEHVLKANKA